MARSSKRVTLANSLSATANPPCGSLCRDTALNSPGPSPHAPECPAKAAIRAEDAKLEIEFFHDYDFAGVESEGVLDPAEHVGIFRNSLADRNQGLSRKGPYREAVEEPSGHLDELYFAGVGHRDRRRRLRRGRFSTTGKHAGHDHRHGRWRANHRHGLPAQGWPGSAGTGAAPCVDGTQEGRVHDLCHLRGGMESARHHQPCHAISDCVRGLRGCRRFGRLRSPVADADFRNRRSRRTTPTSPDAVSAESPPTAPRG